ncbi:unnamed protein product [Gadus morhua 'NCC']
MTLTQHGQAGLPLIVHTEASAKLSWAVGRAKAPCLVRVNTQESRAHLSQTPGGPAAAVSPVSSLLLLHYSDKEPAVVLTPRC